MASRSSQTAPVADAENRKHDRLNIEAQAELKLRSGKKLKGKTSNISYKGAYFTCDDPSAIKSDEFCLLTINVKDKLNDMVLKLKCKIRHVEKNGAGVEIVDFYDDDYNDFVFMLANNSPDPDRFLKELSEHPDFQLIWD